MMEAPDRFNALLENVIASLVDSPRLRSSMD
jgi:hypothetical protein